MKTPITYLVLMTALLSAFAWSAVMKKPNIAFSDATLQSSIATDADTAVSVDVKLLVGADGKISSFEVLAGDMPDLEKSVKEMGKHWQFKSEPGIKAGEFRRYIIPIQSYNTPELMAKFWKQ